MDNKKTTQPMHIIISGGGTGGHIFPALSIANEVKRRHPEAEILFVGAQGRMEMERVPEAGYNIVGLPVAGFDRKRLWRNFKVLAKLYRSIRMAKKILRDFKPDIAVGVGGYASGPMLKAAQGAGIPTLLQEQNSYAGVTNKMLSKKAVKICTAYDNMDAFFPAESIIKTGNPIRANLTECALTKTQAKKTLNFNPDKPLVLVVGGSLGARTVNTAVSQSLLPTIEKADIQLLWQTGKLYADECLTATKDKKGVTATAFISDMATAYRAADLVVSRAGAGTISELQILGMPAVLIPSPNVAENHQYHNAKAVADAGGAVLLEDKDAIGQIAPVVTNLVTDTRALKNMSEKISDMALPNAAKMIVDQIENIITA